MTVSFDIKGGVYPFTTLRLLNNDLQSFQTDLQQRISQAPSFFSNAPVIIDVSLLAQDNISIDLSELALICKNHKIIPVALKGGSPEHRRIALVNGIASLSASTETQPKNATNTSEQPPAKKPQIATPRETRQQYHAAKLITEPVRSGQQIYAANTDLIVTASVSHGAELLADGNIHVYGTLRGRALAGVNGDKSARIFCQSLEAELVSIAGYYKVSEDIENIAWKVAAQIILADNNLTIKKLT